MHYLCRKWLWLSLTSAVKLIEAEGVNISA